MGGGTSCLVLPLQGAALHWGCVELGLSIPSTGSAHYWLGPQANRFTPVAGEVIKKDMIKLANT